MIRGIACKISGDQKFRNNVLDSGGGCVCVLFNYMGKEREREGFDLGKSTFICIDIKHRLKQVS